MWNLEEYEKGRFAELRYTHTDDKKALRLSGALECETF